jgi:hypothetical protein
MWDLNLIFVSIIYGVMCLSYEQFWILIVHSICYELKTCSLDPGTITPEKCRNSSVGRGGMPSDWLCSSSPTGKLAFPPLTSFFTLHSVRYQVQIVH